MVLKVLHQLCFIQINVININVNEESCSIAFNGVKILVKVD